MATINEVIDRLAETIETATGIRCVGIVDSPPAPCIMIYPASPLSDTSWQQAFGRGVVRYKLVLQCVVPSTALRSAQLDLNDWITPFGKRSVLEAVFLAPTLGTDPNEATAGPSAAMTAEASSTPPEEYGFVDGKDGTRYLSCKLFVNVMTRGDR